MLAHVSEEARGTSDDLLGTIKLLVPKLLEQARPENDLGSAPRQHSLAAYLLLSGAIAAAAGSGVSGGFAFSDWATVSTASENKLYGRAQDPGQLGGGYIATKSQVEPLGIVSEVALGIAAGLGIATWIVW